MSTNEKDQKLVDLTAPYANDGKKVNTVRDEGANSNFVNNTANVGKFWRGELSDIFLMWRGRSRKG